MAGHDHNHSHAQGHSHHDHGHAHDHGHSHAHDDLFAHPELGGHGAGGDEKFDAASRSLSDALRVTFRILKFVMVVLVLAFLFGRWVEVKEGEVAVLLRFGAVQGEPGKDVLEPGWHFALPDGIDRVIKVPVNEQQLSLDRAFWFEIKPGDEGKKPEELRGYNGGLVPGKDGSLLTADKNIVHGKWLVSFRVEKLNAVRFARNVGGLDEARRLVEQAAERAMVHVTGQVTADEFVSSEVKRERIRWLAQESLDRLDAGLTLTGLGLKPNGATPPLAVRAEFTAVSAAESTRAQQIEQARRDESTMLIDAAGAQYRELLAAIDAHREAVRIGVTKRIQETEGGIERLLESSSAQGQVYRIVQEAERYKAQIVEKVRGEKETFERLLPQYRENPRIFREKYLQAALTEIFSGDVEKIYLPEHNKDLILEINRDPGVQKARETEGYKQERKGKEK